MKKYLHAAALIAFLAVGLTIGAFIDLPLDKAIYSPDNVFAVFMEAVGYWPLYLPVALMFAVYARSEKLYKKIAGLFLCAVTLTVLVYSGINYTSKRGASAFLVVVPFILIVICLLAVLLNKNMQTLKKLWFLGVSGSAYMILNNIVINIMKALWQRPRFDEMLAAGSLDAFRPWYSILGPGGSSFPSGHTGAACGIFVLLTVCSLYKFWHKKYALMLTLCWGYVAAMAAGRLIIGRHFLSDTVAAAFIGYVIFIAMRRTKIYQKALANSIRPLDLGAK